MKVIQHKSELSKLTAEAKDNGATIGFVPTMGALHEGHLSLIRQALAESDLVVVSIFVNPTQFDKPEDLDKYPVNQQEDIKKLQTLDKNLIVFTPFTREIYENGLETEEFDLGAVADKMEGKFRKGHFDGVATVLKKLFDIVHPDKAFFGEKDYQQLLIVKKLVTLLQLPITVIGCSISRQKGGLARSSRNRRLDKRQQKEALLLYHSLQRAGEQYDKKSIRSLKDEIEEDFKNHPDLKLDYFEIVDAATLDSVDQIENNKKYRAFIAAYIDGVRLIDNLALN